MPTLYPGYVYLYGLVWGAGSFSAMSNIENDHGSLITVVCESSHPHWPNCYG